MRRNTFFLTTFIFIVTILLSACSTSQPGEGGGFFDKYFVEPFTSLLIGTSHLFNDNYGLGIILVTLLVRLILMPLMLKQYKTQAGMKVKMDLLKPEMDEIQKKIKATKDQQEQQKLQKELMGLYQKHGVNPLNMGCLPLIIQMPILMAFYYAIRDSQEIASHSFMWFSLGQPDIGITALAGIVYYLQFKVSMSTMPEAQKQQMKFMGLIIPDHDCSIFFNRPSSASALLGSWWYIFDLPNIYWP